MRSLELPRGLGRIGIVVLVAVVAAGCVDGKASSTAARDGSVLLDAADGERDGEVAPPDSQSTDAGSDADTLASSVLVSRNRPVFASGDVPNPSGLVNGQYCQQAWTTSTFPSWVAIQMVPGPSRLLLNWSGDNGSVYMSSPSRDGFPGSYVIETSANSTNGSDGTWTPVVDVSNNVYRWRAEVFDFTGQSWVRMTVRGLVPGVSGALRIDQLDVHDISNGSTDTVFFGGDSITQAAYNRCAPTAPSYANLVYQNVPSHDPATINGGVGGVTAAFAAQNIAGWLAAMPDFHIWALGYGTNDAALNVEYATFEANIRLVVDAVRDAGHIPVLARVPYSTLLDDTRIRALNEVIDRVTLEEGLMAGPDFYTWFQTHSGDLYDGVHPSDVGSAAMNRLWYEALRPLYP